MTPHDRPILNYAAPSPVRQVNAVARLPVWTIILLAVLVPGLPSLLIARRVALFFLLLFAIPVAFLLFGPFWGEVLFRSSHHLRDAGVWPFLVCVVAVPVVSTILALDDRREAHRGMM